jgi:hypothetical protein
VWRVHTGELYPWRHIPIVPLYPAPVLALEWTLTVALGLALAAGFRLRVTTRLAAAVLFVSLLERFSNHATLLFLVALFLAIDPPDADDAGEQPALGLVRAQIAIVYVFTAWNKIAHGFLGGAALERLLGWPHGRAIAASWAVVAAELALPVLLVGAPRLGILGVAALHASFALFMPGLASFGLAMLAMALLYLPQARR